MNQNWKAPKIIIGKEATGQYYYRREEIENEIWEEIVKSNNILLAAPRRVGKTSVMKYIAEYPKPGFRLIFRNVQGIDTEERFYKTLYELIIHCLSKFKSNRTLIENYFRKMRISEISTSGFKIEEKAIDYLSEINSLIPQLDPGGENIVLLIDELPEVLHEMYKKGEKSMALNIIKNLRHIRQETDFKKIQFFFAGSIGLHYVVKLIDGSSSDINDLNKIQYLPLNGDEVSLYIDSVTKDATIKYSDDLKQYLAGKIQYFVPYFFNIMLDAIHNIAKKSNNPIIDKQSIDVAFESVIKNNDYFKDWKQRLSDYLPKEDFSFVNEILIHIAHKDKISIQEIYDKATKYNKVNDYMDFVNDLEHDGYITEHNQQYVFISPFLKEFWKRNNPVYNG
jgi:hypothetical protein